MHYKFYISDTENLTWLKKWFFGWFDSCYPIRLPEWWYLFIQYFYTYSFLWFWCKCRSIDRIWEILDSNGKKNTCSTCKTIIQINRMMVQRMDNFSSYILEIVIYCFVTMTFKSHISLLQKYQDIDNKVYKCNEYVLRRAIN